MAGERTDSRIRSSCVLSRSVIGTEPLRPCRTSVEAASKMRPMGAALLLLSVPLWAQAPPRAPFVATPQTS